MFVNVFLSPATASFDKMAENLINTRALFNSNGWPIISFSAFERRYWVCALTLPSVCVFFCSSEAHLCWTEPLIIIISFIFLHIWNRWTDEPYPDRCGLGMASSELLAHRNRPTDQRSEIIISNGRLYFLCFRSHLMKHDSNNFKGNQQRKQKFHRYVRFFRCPRSSLEEHSSNSERARVLRPILFPGTTHLACSAQRISSTAPAGKDFMWLNHRHYQHFTK